MRDRYLGILRLVLVLLIAAYVLVKVLLIDKAYNATEIPIGTVRSSLMMPEATIDRAALSYCHGNTAGGEPWPFPAEDYNCAIWDDQYVRFPAEEVNGLFITSRVQEVSQTYNCGDGDITAACPKPFSNAGDPTTSFIAGVEQYTLGLQHSFRSPLFSLDSESTVYKGSSNAYSGVMLDFNGKEVMKFPVDVTSDKPDVFTLGDLLNAAGASLSDPSNGTLHLRYLFEIYDDESVRIVRCL